MEIIIVFISMVTHLIHVVCTSSWKGGLQLIAKIATITIPIMV